MAQCLGCGFYTEQEDVVRANDFHMPPYRECLECRRCKETPTLRESYRRGFNAGLDALKEAVVSTVEKSNLRKLPPIYGDDR
jgi:hypothetical protein